MKYFGNLNQSDGEDFDGLGLPLAQCYQSGVDPNTISFFASVTNQYLSTASVPVHLGIQLTPPTATAGVSVFMPAPPTMFLYGEGWGSTGGCSCRGHCPP